MEDEGNNQVSGRATQSGCANRRWEHRLQSGFYGRQSPTRGREFSHSLYRRAVSV